MANHPSESRRRGAIVHEAAIAIVLAAAILTSVVQILALSAQQSRAMRQRITATREAGDLMEQLMARSWEQLTPEAVAAITLSETCQATLPNAQLNIEIAPRDGAANDGATSDDAASDDAAIGDAAIGDAASDDGSSDGAKQLSIEIVWQQAAGHIDASIHLVAWKYARQEADQ